MPARTQGRPPARPLGSIAEAAERWDVHPRTIRRRVADGTLKAYRLPGSRLIRIDLDELDEVLSVVPSASTKVAG